MYFQLNLPVKHSVEHPNVDVSKLWILNTSRKNRNMRIMLLQRISGSRSQYFETGTLEKRSKQFFVRQSDTNLSKFNSSKLSLQKQWWKKHGETKNTTLGCIKPCKCMSYLLTGAGFLVCGFNSFEKYQSKWESSPNRGEHKNIWNHHLV